MNLPEEMNSSKLLVIVKMLHSHGMQLIEAGVEKTDLHDGIKQLCKPYYKHNRSAIDSGNAGSSYYEACIWGQIHNMNKQKAIRILHKYEKRLSETIDGILFEGDAISITRKEGKNPSFDMNNEEGFRLACEDSTNTIQIFKLLIELI
jgi:hypothetical protein